MKEMNGVNIQKDQVARIRFDGRYEGSDVDMDVRSYTVVSHFIVNGQDLFKCSFTGASVLLAALKGIDVNGGNF